MSDTPKTGDPENTDPSHSANSKVRYSISASTPQWPPRPDAGQAPNIVVMLIDDMGYSDIGCYGSEIPTPELDALAGSGVRMQNFHSAPLCSPTRASLLTGRNPHRAGFGRVASFDPGFPGYSMEFPEAAPTIASELRSAGYATFAVGKWHLAREIEQSAAGSKHGWPLQKGFDRFYGFLDGFTNFFHPHQLTEDNHHLDIDEYPDDYYLTDDLTDRACGMIKELRSADADKPFFLYLAHGAVHAPLHAPESDVEKFKGWYDEGWAELRRTRFERQKELGLIPPDVELPDPSVDSDFGFPAWDELTPDEQRLAARHMEVYAAMVASVDRSVGNLRRTLQQIGEWDNTIVVFMSDNGASSDVGPRNTTQYMMTHGMPIPEGTESDVELVEHVGGPRVLAAYSSGWALACNTPFRMYKRYTHAGGHTVPFIVHWPGGDLPEGVLRPGYAHVSDLFPTLMDLAGIDVNPAGLDGTSFARSLLDPQADTPRREQVYESHGNRGLYADGWEIVAAHRPLRPFSVDNWELYEVERDPTQITNLAGDRPDVVADMDRRWHELAASGEVFPLEDGSGVFFHQRPDFHRPTEPAVFWPGLPTIERIRARDLIWNRSFTIEAHLGRTTGEQGTIVAHGDQASGYSLHVLDGVLQFAINVTGRVTSLDCGSVEDNSVVTVAVSCPELDRWDVAVTVNGDRRAERTGLWMRTGLMTPLHGIDIGITKGSPVVWEMFESHGTFPWTGEIDRVVYIPGEYAIDAPQLRVEEFRAKGLAVEGHDQPIL